MFHLCIIFYSIRDIYGRKNFIHILILISQMFYIILSFSHKYNIAYVVITKQYKLIILTIACKL